MTAASPSAGSFSTDSSNVELPWWRTLDLAERLALPGEPEPPLDETLGRRRLDRWRGAPFHDRALWHRRLDLEGIDEDALARLLSEDSASLGRRACDALDEPAWVAGVRGAYSGAEATEPFDWPEGANLERCPFLPLLEPLIHRAHRALTESARRLAASSSHCLFDPETVARALVASLPDLLAPIISRAMVVELHVARLEERLSGDTPEARFAGFVCGLRVPAVALETLARYPVLARQAWTRIDQWRRGGEVFLRHLTDDADAVAERFGEGETPGRLVDVRGDVSDPHRDGRGVLLLRFETGLRLAYKPKSMRVEVAFQQLLAWLGEHGLEPRLRCLEVLDGGDHGWMEFAAATGCDSIDAIRRFYLRQGAYIALLYFLDGTDFHQENLIAAGEHPHFVDLETLFQPRVNVRELHGMAEQYGGSLSSTVLRTDLLPSRRWGTEDEAGIDMSGLTSREGQLTPQAVVAMTDRGTDSMRVERRRVEVPMAENRPNLGDEAVTALDYTDEIEEGFRRLYGLVIRHRDTLLAPDGPLAAFADAEVRILFRNTATYGAILLESHHPHLQADALERDRLIDSLWHAVAELPFIEALVPFERRDMARGDVPLFLTRPDDRRVRTWDGEIVPVQFEDSGLDRVRAKIAAAGAADLERQLVVLRDSFEASIMASGERPRPSYTLRARAEPASEDALLDAAREIGDRLIRRAFETDHEAQWLTVDYAEPAGWSLVPTGPDVFQGLPGIALFLGYLGEVTREAGFSATARRALWALRQQIALSPELVRGLGVFNGWGGVLWTLTHLGVLWRDDALLDEAESYAEQLPELVAEDTLLDIVAGSAGCLVALLELHRARPRAHLFGTARACGERLLATADPQEAGVGWKIPLADDRVLAGMSHGAAGMALALLRLAGATGDERFAKVAHQAFAFERHLFDAERGNWPDLRVGGADDGLDASHDHEMTAWCHGAPGVGLARVAGLPFADDEAIRGEIAAAVETTLDRGLGKNHCLCHGDLGNLDFLSLAARSSADAALERRVYCLAGGVLDSLEREGPLFGLPGSLETPGLMTGLSGVGFGLLRLAAPGQVPSILALEAPIQPSTSRVAGVGAAASGPAATLDPLAGPNRKDEAL